MAFFMQKEGDHIQKLRNAGRNKQQKGTHLGKSKRILIL